jgi:iron complex transport system ATP-binding protein
MSASVLTLSGVHADLAGRTVLSGVDLSVSPGELVVLCGPNGAGKTSALKAALGLLPITGGSVRLGGVEIGALSSADLARRAAYLAQERRIAWNMPAVEVAALGAPLLAGAEARARALEALSAVGVADLADRGVAEMSGGERARVLFARFLVASAPLMLADEPAAGLDPDAQVLVLDLLRQRADAGAGVLTTLHDLSLAARYADRLVVLDHGQVVEDGPPLQALTPARLSATFGVTGAWAETPMGPVLAFGRAT